MTLLTPLRTASKNTQLMWGTKTMTNNLPSRLKAADKLNGRLLGEVFCKVLPDTPEDLYQKLIKWAEYDAWETAALALVKELLPGWGWHIAYLRRSDTHEAELISRTRFRADHDSPAIALILVLLTALEAEGGDDAE